MTTISNATIALQQNDLWAEVKREPSSIESPPLVRTPSTTVTLTDKNLIDTDFYSQLEQRIANNAQQKWELPLSDYASNLMARNFNGHSNANRFLGLSGAMLERFKSPPADFKQSVTQIGPQANKAASELEKGTISLNIKTRSGVSIELKLSNQGDQLAAEVKTNGELTAAEQTAISQLAKGFETTIQNLLAEPPRAEIDALMKFDVTQLATLDLTTNFANKNGETMTFKLHADERQREIQLQTPQGKMSVNVNFQQAAALGNAQQREKAIGQYLTQFDHAGERGKPNAEMLSLFKTVFSGLHKNHPSDAIAVLNAPPQAKALNDLEQAVLTGLGDFQADLTMKPTSPNPRKPLEMDHFSFQLKQKTSVLGKTSITQKQEAQLSASYHEALNTKTPPKLDSTKESQNYLYKTIQDHASSSIDVQFDNQRQLKSAKLEKSAQQSTHTLRYEMDKMTKETRLPEQAHFIQDLLTTMNSLQKRSNDSETDLLLKKQKLGELNEMIFLNTDPFSLAKTRPIKSFQREST